MKEKPGKKKIIEIKHLQEQVNSFLNIKVEWNLKKLLQKSFERANKPGKYLACQLEKRKEKQTISKIIKEDKVIMDQQEIKGAFLSIMLNGDPDKMVS